MMTNFHLSKSLDRRDETLQTSKLQSFRLRSFKIITRQVMRDFIYSYYYLMLEKMQEEAYLNTDRKSIYFFCRNCVIPVKNLTVNSGFQIYVQLGTISKILVLTNKLWSKDHPQTQYDKVVTRNQVVTIKRFQYKVKSLNVSIS